jgi:hypothetical protein
MHLERVVFLTTLLTACMVMPASAQEALAVSKSKTDGDCTCPKEGRWKAQNLEGWMNCTGPVNFKRTLEEVKDTGTVWILDDECSEVFGEASKKKDEDILLQMTEDCTFEGTINGDEDGVKMVIDVKWELENDGFIKGEMHSSPSLQGMMCEYYRPYEIYYDEPIPAADYEKLKKKMEEKLEAARKRDGVA